MALPAFAAFPFFGFLVFVSVLATAHPFRSLPSRVRRIGRDGDRWREPVRPAAVPAAPRRQRQGPVTAKVVPGV
ncbi:hypothetical protein [Streptomyces paludis]|uniref:Uncharacterized protein n=1 Tax=Streptomyces paludis TaxID=2282738 RepID=A0A345HW91_9ACTN|nr:hypothetical protein [Streptomyces paludis]AXG80965.1 hypothetical protein DVK44_28545 [Streptomyces paludis]